MTKCIQLDESAKQFVLSVLTEGTSFSLSIARSINISNGTLYTIIPNGADIGHVNQYSYGGLMPQNDILKTSSGNLATLKPSTDIECVEEILRIKDIYLDSLLIIEAQILKTGDTKTIAIPQAIVNGEEVFLCTKLHGLINKNDILNLLCMAKVDWPFTIAISALDYNFYCRNEENYPFAEIANKVVWLAISAYDGEGYIMWAK